MSEEPLAPESLNVRALVGLVVAVAVAVVGLFALPTLQSALDLDFFPAFWLTLAVEFVAFLGVAISVLRLHREQSFE
jgi:uncharacterized membrane protein